MPNPHPEAQIGIPFIVITAKTAAAKEATAKRHGYTGPLTLLDAVRAGRVEPWDAISKIEYWYRGGGVDRGFVTSWCQQIEAVEAKKKLVEEREKEAETAE